MSNHDQLPITVPSFNQPAPPSPGMDYDSEMSRGWDLREYLNILLKRKWWIIGTFFTVTLLVTVYTLTRTPIYRTTALLQITQDNPGSGVTADVDRLSSRLSGTADDAEKFQQTQYKILQSWSLAQRVIQALNLKEHPDFKPDPEAIKAMSASEIEDAMVYNFLGNLEVTPVKNSYLVEVSYQSSDKVLAQRVVNAVASEYMYLSIDRRNESFSLVRNWLDKQLQGMAGKVQDAQKKLFKFGQKTDIYALEDKDNVIVQKFIDLNGLLTKAQADKMAKEAQYKEIKENGLNAPVIVNHPLVAALRQQLVGEQAKVSAMQKVLRAGHPDLQAERANLAELQGRLQAEIRRIQESVKADYEAACRTEKLLSDSLAAQKGEMVKLQDHLTDYQILKRDAQTNEQLYQALLARVKEANIAGTMVPSNVMLIDSARLPTAPYKPRTRRNIGLAMVLGLSLGVGLALMLEYMDDSIKSLDDLERSCSLPSLGILPVLGERNKITLSLQGKSNTASKWRFLPRLQRRSLTSAEAADLDLLVFKHPKSPVSEAIGHVYSSIMLSTSGRPPCAIMITSPNPSEGKSMLACNLAQSCAMNDRPAVLIDCDLRKPRLHQAFQMESSPGLTNYLTGNASLEEILRPTCVPNLTIITAGARPPSPANLLNSEIFKELLTDLRQRFNQIIIDTPPVLGFADARFVSVMVDGVLLVTKYHVTHKSAGRLAHQLLSQAPVLGVVLNSVGSYGQSYGTYYYYYQYKYYSKYYGDKPSLQ
jgi:succinoglycan biosynthesis transport protein ExoP